MGEAVGLIGSIFSATKQAEAADNAATAAKETTASSIAAQKEMQQKGLDWSTRMYQESQKQAQPYSRYANLAIPQIAAMQGINYNYKNLARDIPRQSSFEQLTGQTGQAQPVAQPTQGVAAIPQAIQQQATKIDPNAVYRAQQGINSQGLYVGPVQAMAELNQMATATQSTQAPALSQAQATQPTNADEQAYIDQVAGMEVDPSLKPFSMTYADLAAELPNDPLYQYQLQEAQKAMNQNLAARGKFFSGKAAEYQNDAQRKLTAETTQNLYNRKLSENNLRYQRLADALNIGRGFAANTGQNAMQVGSSGQSSYNQLGQGIGSSYQNLGNALQTSAYSTGNAWSNLGKDIAGFAGTQTQSTPTLATQSTFDNSFKLPDYSLQSLYKKKYGFGY